MQSELTFTCVVGNPRVGSRTLQAAAAPSAKHAAASATHPANVLRRSARIGVLFMAKDSRCVACKFARRASTNGMPRSVCAAAWMIASISGGTVKGRASSRSCSVA